MPKNTEELEVTVGSVPDSTETSMLEVTTNVPTDEETIPIPEEPPPKPKQHHTYSLLLNYLPKTLKRF